MYKIEEAFNNIMDDFLVDMVDAAAIARDESLQVQPCASSEPPRGRTASQTICDAVVLVEHLVVGIQPAKVKTEYIG